MSNLANMLVHTAAWAALAAQEGYRSTPGATYTDDGVARETVLDGITVTAPRRTSVPPATSAGFSLSTFLTEINTKAVLDTSRHLMMFTLPKGLLTTHDANAVRQIVLRCEASSLPGISFAESEEIRRYGVGPTEKHPYLPIFGAISTSYIVDGEGFIHSFFYDWMSYMVGFDSSQGMTHTNAFGNNPYEVAYKDDYASTASVLMYNEKNDKIIEVKLNSAYPIAINAVPLNWSNTEQVMRLDVTWDYRDWSATYHEPSRGPDPFRPGPRDINRQQPTLLDRFSQLTGSLPANVNLQSLIAQGSVTQRVADIHNLVNNARQTIISNVRGRLGF